MRTRTLFLVGLLPGAVLGLAFVVSGPAIMVGGAFVLAWIIAYLPRFASASGGLIGFGVVSFVLVGQAALRCATDTACSGPDVTPWLALSAALIAVGVVLGLETRRRLARAGRDQARRLGHRPGPPRGR